MIIAALKEESNESRVAITPHVVKHYTQLGLQVVCEPNAGVQAGFSDELYSQMGAHFEERKKLLPKANILLCVNEPKLADLKQLPPQALTIGPINHQQDSPLIACACQYNLSLLSMNLIPRISRAQGMDSLSSQANLAGYRAVLEAVVHFNRAIPMMMTAAGMIQPAKVLVLGAGVAGLQAIATAKRLGAVVYVFDVRRAAKEQVESLGAEFIEVRQDEDAETQGGYAGEVTEQYKRLQAEKIDHYAKLVDIIIATALIPDKKAPLLIHRETVDGMKKGSVIVDLATSRGGNCEVSQPDKIIHYNSITIIGYSNMASFVPATASELYSNNLCNLVKHLFATGNLVFDEQDEIIKQATLCLNGSYLPFHANKEHSHG